jgi:hypothetical protein
MRKKLIPYYFRWTLLFTISTVLFWLWVIGQGLHYEKKYTLDLLGYSTALAALILLALQMHELWILIKFLQVENGRTIAFCEAEQKLAVYKKDTAETFLLKDLEKIIFSNSRIMSRTATADLSYSQLNFKSKQPILITSYLLNMGELKKLLQPSQFKITASNRRNFEGIMLK